LNSVLQAAGNSNLSILPFIQRIAATMEDEFRQLLPDEPFPFACHKTVACFNECCRDLNQSLTPYDLLRLKTGLGLSTTEFLTTYTRIHTGPETGLPVPTLRPRDNAGLTCPFVTPHGCRVYENRPSSCRIYPLARAISRSRRTGHIREHFALLKEPHCLGHAQDHTQTVREWIMHQGLEAYFRFNDMLIEIIALKNQTGREPLDVKARILFQTALYDIDAFRSQVFDQGLLDKFPVDSILLDSARTDDTALLHIGHAWVKAALFDARQ
jgi:Fe-S-cluster containining protein